MSSFIRFFVIAPLITFAFQLVLFSIIGQEKDAPTCRHEKVMIIGASRSENLEIVCEVDADPPADSFRWKFNNSGETLDVGPERFTSNGTASALKYTPVADLDYGTLSCWAQNSIGLQVSPCVYQLVAAGKPQGVQNCSLSNQTNSSVEVKCSPGYDGGLPQVFTLEVYTSYSSLPVYNVTEKEFPIFRLSNLQPDVIFKILVTAVNSKGRSLPVVLEDFSFKGPEKRTADGLNIGNMSPFVIKIAFGTIIGVVVLVIILVLNFWKSKKIVASRSANNNVERKHDQIIAAPITNHCDDMNPDIIPAKYEPAMAKRRSLFGVANDRLQQNQNWEDDKTNSGLNSETDLAYNKTKNIDYQTSDHFCRSTESITSIKVKTISCKKEDDLNCTAIKETLMANRLPESCV